MTRAEGRNGHALVARGGANGSAEALRSAAHEPPVHAILEHVPVCVYVMELGEDRRLSYVSPEIERMLGSPPEDWLGSGRWDRSIHPEDREWTLAARRLVAEGPGPYDAEYRMLARDGSVIWVRDKGTVVTTGEGRPLLIEGVLIDITQRKEAELALRELSARKEAVLDAALDAVVTIDHTGRVIEFNPAAERTFGYSSEEASGREMSELIVPPGLREQHQRGLERYLSTGQGRLLGRRIEITAMRADGTEFPVELTVTRASRAEPPIFTGFLRDISDRKVTEDALRAGWERAQRYLDVAQTMIVVIGPDRAVEVINQRGRAVLGYEEEEIVGRDFLELVVPEQDMDAVRTGFARMLGGDQRLAEYSEMTVQTKAGEQRLVAWRATLLRDAEGAVTAVLGSGDDITDHRRADEQRQRAEEQIAFLAYHDGLTGLPNRTLLEEHLELAMARARRHELSVALLQIDLDGFKLINDSLGRAAGDELLRRVPERLRHVVRNTDLLTRQGGDEFLLLVTDIKGNAATDAETIAGHIAEALDAPFTVAGAEFHIGASIGISLFPADAQDAATLLAHADAAVHEAKRAGRGGCSLYAHSEADPRERLQQITRLRGAIAREEFELQYQPIFELPRLELWGVEALLRWRDPDRGLVSPAEFIPLAEDTGLIEPIGDWVIGEIGRQALAWRAEGLLPRISFNVSPRQLRRPQLVRVAREGLTAEGLDAGRFTVEVTESAAMQEAEAVVPVLRGLHDLGLQLAIDDFGAGFSSLSRLREMPVDVLKIDRSFLRDVPGDANAESLVAAIVDFAEALGLGTVAEGVETEEQRDFLVRAGCSLAQGFLMGRPASVAEATELLRAG